MSRTPHGLAVGQMDDWGHLDSPIHRLDARVKALTTAAFLVVVMSFDRYTVSALIPFFLFPAVMLSVARIPPGPLLRMLLIASPFALLVGLFNPLLDRTPVAQLGPWTLSGGWISLANIVLRFALTVGAALVLLASTGLHRLCAGLQRLGVPAVFVTQLLLLYRYLFVIAAEGARMLRSAQVRAGPGSLSLRVYGALVGHLLLRSLDRAQRVYQAMVARGYGGEIRRLDAGRLGGADFAFMAGWLLYFAVARRWNLAEWLGRWWMGDGS